MKQQFMRSVLLGATLYFGAGTAMAASDKQWDSGAQVYAKVCGHCHEANIGPVIKGRELPPAYTKAIVRHGFRAMPSFRSAFIDDASLDAVAEFIRTSPATPSAE